MEALKNEFSYDEVEYLDALISDNCKTDTDAYKYLSVKYKQLQTRKNKIKTSSYGYLRAIIEAEVEKNKERANARQSPKNKASEMSEAERAEELERLERLLKNQTINS
jgi:hypothetical protein